MTVVPELSVVVPVKDEVGNAVPLLNEICAALRGRVAFEVLFVDDASTDGTVAALLAAKSASPELRVLKHKKNSGQSRAVRTGVIAARGRLVATLDGDGQNDPADIPALLEVWKSESSKPGQLGLVDHQHGLARRLAAGVRQDLAELRRSGKHGVDADDE